MTNVLILAGGAGTRLAGREYPKALFRIGIKPIIEILTDQILRYLPDAAIWVVTKDQWRIDFERWVEAYVTRTDPSRSLQVADRSASPVQLVFEESDLDPVSMPDQRGTLPAIYRTLQWLRVGGKINDGDVFHVALADNYFDEDTDADQPNAPSLANILRQSKQSIEDDPRCRGATVAYTLPDSRAASKYGVIRLCEDRPWIKELIEKPPHPRRTDRLISTGYYVFRNNADTVRDWGLYLKTWQDNPRSRDEDGQPVNPDMAFWIADYIAQKQQPCAESASGYIVCFEFKGTWVDIGTPSDLLRVTSDYLRRYVDAIRTIEDLKGRAHHLIADQYFVYARPRNLSFNGSTLEINFDPKDPITKDKLPRDLKTNPDPWIQWVAEVVASPLAQRNGIDVPPGDPGVAASRVFFSGGVLLIDSSSNHPDQLQRTKSTIAFQRRDFGARIDPDRLTMPAGALDSLSLTECCYSEMQEEMICYGERVAGMGRILFYLEPFVQGLRLTREDFLEHVADAVRRGLQLPGIDPVSIYQALSDPTVLDSLIEPVPVKEHDLSAYRHQGGIWEIVLRVGDQVMDRGWFFVSVDLLTQTLECRKVVVADLSHFRHPQDPQQRVQPSASLLYGRLAGIADGEGFGRLPLMYRADALINYMNELTTLNRDQILERLLSGPDLVGIQCSGRAGSGRFERFGFVAPVVATTKTVGDMLRFLPNLF